MVRAPCGQVHSTLSCRYSHCRSGRTFTAASSNRRDQIFPLFSESERVHQCGSKASVVKMATKVDPRDPNVRRIVYNMYRGMLGNYNDKANDIISTLPKEMVREDQGIARQLESMM